MKVLFNTYPTAMLTPGGGEIQLHKSREYLIRLGVEVELFDMWSGDFGDCDVVHMFSARGGALDFHHLAGLG